MKVFIPVGCAAALVLAACGDNKTTTATPTNSTSSSSPLNAPADYLGAMGKAQQSAVKTVDTTSLNKAIQLFNVDQGRNPKDLDELVQKKYIPKLPEAPNGMKLVYDANAGTVKVQKQ